MGQLHHSMIEAASYRGCISQWHLEASKSYAWWIHMTVNNHPWSRKTIIMRRLSYIRMLSVWILISPGNGLLKGKLCALLAIALNNLQMGWVYRRYHHQHQYYYYHYYCYYYWSQFFYSFDPLKAVLLVLCTLKSGLNLCKWICQISLYRSS